MDTLVVPVLSPSGQVHFVSLLKDATVRDAIDALKSLDDVAEDVLEDLKDEGYGWALQKVQREETGRNWEEDELEALDDGEPVLPLLLESNPNLTLLAGFLPPDTPLNPLLTSSSSSSRPSLDRHFSAFPLTSHLHTPYLRVISLHPYLKLHLSFARVPDIHRSPGISPRRSVP